ncbi:MAG: hypothetical protein DMG16_30520 [Acidobacteria bacterium]|nr:MAG: hypothetical protein DMG16_30520 [Acidobacteriota bacterium]
MAQGEVGEFGESLSFYHLAARIIHPNAKNANANLTNANFLLISLSYLGIELACEVPVCVVVRSQTTDYCSGLKGGYGLALARTALVQDG